MIEHNLSEKDSCNFYWNCYPEKIWNILEWWCL